MFIEIAHVDTGERIREDEGGPSEWEQFKESFPKFGQLQSIRVEKDNGKYKLIAGKRRLRAISELHASGIAIPGLPLGFIEASTTDPLPVRTKLLQEFAENNERKDFNFLEKAKFIRRFHETMQVDMGEDLWTQDLTAATLNISRGSISHYLRVEEAAKSDEAVAKASTLDAAVKRMKTQEKLSARHESVKKTDNSAVARAETILVCGDAMTWMPTLDDESFDFVNFDPPWGDDVAHKSQENHEAFDDSTEYANKLMNALFPHVFRVLKQDRFCVFWHRQWATETMAKLAESYGFNLAFTRTPCIWYKPDKTSDQNRNPEKALIDAYETFFILRKGDPVFHERMVNNVFPHDRVPKIQVIHPTEKPLSLCNDILRLCTVPGESIIDPTAGSSAILEQALRSNRKPLGCELSVRNHERGITRLAEYLKNVRNG